MSDRQVDPDALALAPFVARDYHGGQFTALYAYGSSGGVVPGLSREAAEAALIAEKLAAEAWEAGNEDEATELLIEAEALRAAAIAYEEEDD